MLDFGGGKVLVVERFDRLWTEDGRLLRLPQEDFCQALSVPSTLKYEADEGPGLQAILKLLQGSDAPEEDQALFLKAVAAFWLLAALDHQRGDGCGAGAQHRPSEIRSDALAFHQAMIGRPILAVARIVLRIDNFKILAPAQVQPLALDAGVDDLGAPCQAN